MLSGAVIFYKIASICLLIFVGYIAKRMKLVPENSLNALSHYIISIATPCFILTYMPMSITAETALANWHFPVLGAALVGICDMTGWLSARFFVNEGLRPTFRLIAAVPNWVFLALAVSEPLFGADGIRVVLLFNLGITAYLWSLGLTSFRQGMGWKIVKSLLLNTQIICTAIGLGLALFVPFIRTVYDMQAADLAALPFHLGLVSAAWETVVLIGKTCLAMSIFQIGVRLGDTPGKGSVEVMVEKKNNYALATSSFFRLILAPVICSLILTGLVYVGVPLTYSEFLTAVIIMSMPTATIVLTIADVYGGDTLLSARSIIWTTLASLATVPLIAKLADIAFAAIQA